MSSEIVLDQPMEMLISQLLEWLDLRERTRHEVIEVWHTSCPRLAVWEEANQRGLVTHAASNGIEVIRLTSAGAAVLRQHRFLEIMRNYLRWCPNE